MLSHIALPDPNDYGRFIVGYIIPGTVDRVSVVQAGLPTYRRAQGIADRLNADGEAEDARLLAIANMPPPEERHKPPPGMYADNE